MSVMQVQRVVVASMVLGVCMPLLAEEAGQKQARQERPQARLNEEGRAIMEAHRASQQERMREQAKVQRQERAAFRETLVKEPDPHKQLDVLEANIKDRQAARAAQRESGQQARMEAYARALEVSGVPEGEREQAMVRMLSRHQERSGQRGAEGGAYGDKMLEKIAALRAKPDLTTADIRQAMQQEGEKRQMRAGEDGAQRREMRQRPGRPVAEE
jgi:hypothetical protein